MSQTTVIDHISLEDLPPHVISYLSGYPPSERGRITKKLLAYAVSKLEQKSEKPQTPNRYYQPPTWWGHEDHKEIKKNKKSSKLPIEDRFPKRMVDEMTQTSDAYVRTPEKMPKGTRGYKKLLAEPPRHKLSGNKKSMGLELEKTTVISVSSSSEPLSSDTISSENEDDLAINIMRNKDPFFVASIKKSTTNFLKRPQQTKELRHSPQTPPTPQTPTQIHKLFGSNKADNSLSSKNKHQSTSALKHKRTQSSASKSFSKDKDKTVAPSSPPKAKYKTTVEIADEFLESTFMAYLKPPPKEDDDLERNDDLEEIIYKARRKVLEKK